MALKIASGTTTSTAANTKSANLVSGTYEFAPNDGELTVYARASATGINLTLTVNGTQLINDLPVEFFGATGALTKADHEVASFAIPQGARVEFYLRNTTGGALTTDYSVELEEYED
jgi:hypothetical protein